MAYGIILKTKVVFVDNLKLYKFVKKYLKSYFIQYRPFFVFLLRFFLVYAGLTLLYKFYLNQFVDLLLFQVDGLTQLVADQTQKTLLFFNYNCQIKLHESQDSIRLFLNQVSIARIVEGCNGVSVIILFVAFVVAFKGKLKHTLLYILTGILIIHVLNVLRIVLLCIALYHYPESEHILHGIIFPLFIYGVVFGLWVIWVNKFSLYVSKTKK